MKRILSACLEQTNRFENQTDYDNYIANLDRKQIKYKIVDKQEQPDKSLIVKVKKQYNHYEVGEYLN